MHRRAVDVLTSAVSIAALLAGCALPGKPGDRASMGCPEDETCSEETPEGLLFSDARPLAVDGINTVEIRSAGVDPYMPLPPFRATSSRPSVLEITDRPGAGIPLRGVAPGSALLRIVDVDTGELLDRIEIRVDLAVVGRVTPAETLPQRHFIDPWTLHESVRSLRVSPILLAEDGTPLVDQNLTFSSPLLSEEPEELAIPPEAESVPVEIQGAEQIWNVEIPRVDGVDGLTIAPAAEVPPPREWRGWDVGSGAVCAAGTHEDRAVFGVFPSFEWTTRSRGTVELTPLLHCTWPGPAGRGVLTARVAGLEEQVDLLVPQPGTGEVEIRGRREALANEPTGFVPGERARNRPRH